MVEALVAALIFAFGILGVVGLQVNMTHTQTLAKQRVDAMNLAQELFGTMWASYPDLPVFDSATGNCAGLPTCQAWIDKVAQAMPQGTATVTVNAAAGGGGLVTVVLNWTTKTGPQNYRSSSAIVPQQCGLPPPQVCF